MTSNRDDAETARSIREQLPAAASSSDIFTLITQVEIFITDKRLRAKVVGEIEQHRMALGLLKPKPIGQLDKEDRAYVAFMQGFVARVKATRNESELLSLKLDLHSHTTHKGREMKELAKDLRRLIATQRGTFKKPPAE